MDGWLQRGLRSKYATVRQAMVDRRIEAKAYAHEWGTDLPEIADWLWPDASGGSDSAVKSTGGDNE